MLGLWPLATALPTVQVDVDLSAGTEPFQKNWQRSFGSGHALLGMRADWQAHLKRCIAELGLRGVRMHGIFDDDMSVEPARGTFYWYNVDVVLDFLVEQGVTPIVELSFMPSSIAQDTTRYAFRNRGGYKGLLSPPAAFADWYDLVLAFATHVVDRHGLGIIGRWAFEVWNEMWGMPFPSAYMPLYNA
jgi:xylan 1,4-beta-xylosidase